MDTPTNAEYMINNINSQALNGRLSIDGQEVEKVHSNCQILSLAYGISMSTAEAK